VTSLNESFTVVTLPTLIIAELSTCRAHPAAFHRDTERSLVCHRFDLTEVSSPDNTFHRRWPERSTVLTVSPLSSSKARLIAGRGEIDREPE
jgi:hypothetical protein